MTSLKKIFTKKKEALKRLRLFHVTSFILAGGFSVASLCPLPALATQAPFCESIASHIESQYRIPHGVLSSMALTESRYTPSGHKTHAWPWTVQSQGKGRYYKNKNDAIKAVLKLQASGVKSIDVGCMQINLKHHPKAFKNINEALDPQKNVEYAARYLVSLRRRTGSWEKAVAYYHSAHTREGGLYLRRVTNTFTKREKSRAHVSLVSTFSLSTHKPAARVAFYMKADPAARTRAARYASTHIDIGRAEEKQKNLFQRVIDFVLP